MPRQPALAAACVAALVAAALAALVLRDRDDAGHAPRPGGQGTAAPAGPRVAQAAPDRPVEAGAPGVSAGAVGPATRAGGAGAGAPGDAGPQATPGAVRGRVTDAEGRPIPGAGVVLAGVGGEARGEPVARAGADGRFVLTHLPPTGLIEVEAPGWATRVVPVDAAGPELEVVLVRARRLTGRVVAEADGRPLAQARVEAEAASWRAVARADEGGRFAFEDAPEGEVALLLAAAEGHVTATGEAPAAGDAEVLLRLARGRAVRGRVVDAGGRPAEGALVWITGGAQLAHPQTARTDARGAFEAWGLAPDEPVSVVALAVDGATPLDDAWRELPAGAGEVLDVGEVVLAPLGAVEVTGAPDGPLELVAVSCPPGHPAARVPARARDARGARFLGVVAGAYRLVLAGREVGEPVVVPPDGGLCVVPWPQPAPEERAPPAVGAIEVFVGDEAGRPVRGARVLVAGPAPAGGQGGRWTAFTGDDGRALVEDLPAAALQVTAEAPGRALHAPGLAALDDPLAGRRARVTLVLARAARLEGAVVTAEGGAPLQGELRLALPGEDGAVVREVATRPDGTFALEVFAGTFELEVTADGRVPRQLRVTLPAGAPLRVALEPDAHDHDHAHDGEHGH